MVVEHQNVSEDCICCCCVDVNYVRHHAFFVESHITSGKEDNRPSAPDRRVCQSRDPALSKEGHLKRAPFTEDPFLKELLVRKVRFHLVDFHLEGLKQYPQTRSQDPAPATIRVLSIDIAR